MNLKFKIIVLISVLFNILSFLVFSKKLPNSLSNTDTTLLDLEAQSSREVEGVTASRFMSIGKSGSLGERLAVYENCIVEKDWVKLYSLRSDSWKAAVPLSTWIGSIKEKESIKHVYVICSSPIPAKSKPATGFQITKVAAIEDKKAGFQIIAYIENWVFQKGEWVCFGGAPWEPPVFPVISAEPSL